MNNLWCLKLTKNYFVFPVIPVPQKFVVTLFPEKVPGGCKYLLDAITSEFFLVK